MASMRSRAGQIGEALKRRAQDYYLFTPAERQLIDETRVLAESPSFFRDIQRQQDLKHEVAEYTPRQVFLNQPYSRPEMYLRDQTIIPQLMMGNLKGLASSDQFLVPERVFAHELGHVRDALLHERTSESSANAFRRELERRAQARAGRTPASPIRSAVSVRGRYPLYRHRHRYLYEPNEEESY